MEKDEKMVPELRFKEFSAFWEEIKLGKLLNITSSSRVHKDEWTHKGVSFYRSSDVVAAFKGTKNTKAYIPIELYDTLTKKIGRVKKEDILITGGGSIGIPYLVKTNEPLYFKDADLLWIKNDNKVIGYFLYSYFTSQSFKKYIKSISHVGTIAHYTVIQAKNTPCHFPTLPEQQKIASFLTAVDSKIQQLTSKKELLEQYKKGVMQQVFKQEIRFKDEQGNDYPAWEEKQLGEVATFSKGKGISKSDIEENGRLECIRYGQLYTVYGETIHSIVSRTNVVKDELVLSNENDIIIPASGETLIDIAKASCVTKSGVALGGDLNIIKTDNDGVFLSYYLNNAKKNDIARSAQGISVVHLYASQLKRLKINLPSLPEQQKIASFLSSIDQKIEEVGAQLDKAKEWKKGLLQKMFV